PYAEGQIPNYYNYKRSGRPGDMERSSTVRHIDLKNANLFPFGFGMSYTRYDYAPFSCSDTFDANGKLRVSVRVTNSGKYDGEETVQVYVADKVASMVRPVKELKGFKKVFIPKGKTVEVEIEIDANDLGFWTNEMKYVVEPGEFTIMVGPDSQRLQKKNVTLVDTHFLTLGAH
ncbi:MAG: fibronectin type III-like domain-contianing protein, partial [Prevotella sp.]|nr:fibronectin type III-like domain-contianing protein [Prevotella sp.]